MVPVEGQPVSFFSSFLFRMYLIAKKTRYLIYLVLDFEPKTFTPSHLSVQYRLRYVTLHSIMDIFALHNSISVVRYTYGVIQSHVTTYSNCF